MNKGHVNFGLKAWKQFSSELLAFKTLTIASNCGNFVLHKFDTFNERLEVFILDRTQILTSVTPIYARCIWSGANLCESVVERSRHRLTISSPRGPSMKNTPQNQGLSILLLIQLEQYHNTFKQVFFFFIF